MCSVDGCLGKTPFQALKKWGETQAGGLWDAPLASQMLPCWACTSHLPHPSHSLPCALMDIKNRTNQAWRWEQTGLDCYSHSAVKCKTKKGQMSCIPQDTSRFFNTVVPPHISLWMLHYISMSLKYLPFLWTLLGALRACYKPSTHVVCAGWLAAVAALHQYAAFSWWSFSCDRSHSFMRLPPP